MITFKALVVANNRRKDGTYPVKIRVTYKGIVRRLPTTLICTSADLTRTLKIKSPDILNKADALISRMRDAIKDISPFDLESKDVDWVVSHIKDKLSGDHFRLDFFEWSDQYLLSKIEGNRNGYKTAVNSFARFLGHRSLDINDITQSMLVDYIDYVQSEPKMAIDQGTKEYKKTKISKSKSTSTKYLLLLQHIYNSAKDKYNDEDTGKLLIPKSPFAKIKKSPIIYAGQRNIGKDLMQEMISYQTDDQYIRFSLDLFIVSFGLMGANLVDLYEAKPVKVTWVYNRSKTRDRRVDASEHHVDIPVELKPYLERLKGKRGHWLMLADKFDDKDDATRAANRGLKRWCKIMGIDPAFTFYAARHTFASLGRAAGIEKATIDDCLAHKGDYAITDIYAEKSWNLMQDANRKVLDLFSWE